MTVTIYNVPAEWKQPQRRAQCPACHTEMWTKDGQMPVAHHRPDGRACHMLRRTTYRNAPTYRACEKVASEMKNESNA